MFLFLSTNPITWPISSAILSNFYIDHLLNIVYECLNVCFDNMCPSIRQSVCHVSNGCKYLWLLFYLLLYFYFFLFFLFSSSSTLYRLYISNDAGVVDCCCFFSFAIVEQQTTTRIKKIYNFLLCLIMSNRQLKGNLFNIFISFLSTHLQNDINTYT